MIKGKELLYLAKDDVARAGLTMGEIIEVLEDAFAEKGQGNVEMPPKPGIHTRKDAFIYAMPAWIPKLKSAGLKWVSGYPGNQQKGLPYISGLLILNCPETGLPLAVMDCTWITAMRTGAVTGLAAKYLARPESEVVGILGCGVQGRTNLEALTLTCPNLKKVFAYDIYPEVAEGYAVEMQQKFSLEVLPTTSPREAAADSDIIVTAGPIIKDPTPVIEAGWFKEGALAAPVDFDSFWQPAALHKADQYFVDDKSQYEYYKTAGYFKDVPPTTGELADLVLGKAGRRHEKERIITMNLGLALEDMATAIRIYEKALQAGVGTILPL